MTDGPSWQSAGRLLVIAGAVMLGLGLLLIVSGRTGLIGRFPGDLVIRRRNWSLWVPLVSSVLLSIILTRHLQPPAPPLT